jgi:hypothetical protein
MRGNAFFPGLSVISAMVLFSERTKDIFGMARPPKN